MRARAQAMKSSRRRSFGSARILPFRRPRKAPEPRQGPARRRRAVSPLAAVAGAFLILLAPALGDLANGYMTRHVGCRVVGVIDGDTLRILCPGPEIASARIVGFDTPETFSPRCLQETLLGFAATWRLRAALWSAEAITVERRGTDRYGRVLARMRVDGADIAGVMIASGLARPYEGGARATWCS